MQLANFYFCFPLQTIWFGLHVLCGLARCVSVSFHRAARRCVVFSTCDNLLRRGVRIKFGGLPPARDVKRPTAGDNRGYRKASGNKLTLTGKSE